MSGGHADHQFHGSTGSPCTVAAHPEPVEGWLARARPPPKAHAPPGGYDGIVSPYADGDLQLQTHADTIYGDPEYTWDEYIQS